MMMTMAKLAVMAVVGVSVAAQTRPNIVFILADDLGWNDVSWHDAQVRTPNLQSLADEGVVLEQSYVQALCTPTRSTLLTGYYPYHLGRQVYGIEAMEPTGLTLNKTLLPEWLKDLGYDTHLIGKWHLGFCDWAYTPTYRGFDTFYGYYGPMQTYYTHVYEGGYDFRDGEKVELEAAGTYSAFLFGDRAVEIIKQQEGRESPFFLYLALQNVHTPLSVPREFEDLYPDESDLDRRTLLGMVTAMDDVVGRVVDALRNSGFLNNTLVVFSSDNGGESPGVNLPLRGEKDTLWEGGTRVPGLLYGSMLFNTPRTHSGLLHVSDWYTTLLSAAGATTLPTTDGVDQWDALRTGQTPSIRDSLIYDLDQDPTGNVTGAIRVGRYKLVMGEDDDNETGPWLFDLDADPNETTNLAGVRPDLVLELESLLLAQLDSLVPRDKPGQDPAGDPSNWEGIWSPGWCVAH